MCSEFVRIIAPAGLRFYTGEAYTVITYTSANGRRKIRIADFEYKGQWHGIHPRNVRQINCSEFFGLSAVPELRLCLSVSILHRRSS
jgi:hypothetical protein